MDNERLAKLVATHCSPCFRIAEGDMPLDPNVRLQAWELTLVVLTTQFQILVRRLCEAPETRRGARQIAREILAYPKGTILQSVAQRRTADLLTTYIMTGYGLLEAQTNRAARIVTEDYQKNFNKKLGKTPTAKEINAFDVLSLQQIKDFEATLFLQYPEENRLILIGDIHQALTFSLQTLIVTFQQLYEMLCSSPSAESPEETLRFGLELAIAIRAELMNSFNVLPKE